ncbi:MAG: hypothetical protein ACTFAL_10725 [Candidatus Electronema sp. V4]|uniref:hypothetical protein n=1 Tax=Candidatus Electronema sp. V4 TaxID=3454756 RepID=UPI00405574D5
MNNLIRFLPYKALEISQLRSIKRAAAFDVHYFDFFDLAIFDMQLGLALSALTAAVNMNRIGSCSFDQK